MNQNPSTSSGSKFSSADFLFIVQILGGAGLMIPMMARNLTSIEGVSLSFFLVLVIFCGLQLSIAIPAYIAKPTRKAWQAVAVYIMWIVLQTLNIVEILWLGVYRWDMNDTVTLVLTFTGTAAVVAHSMASNQALSDPITKSRLAMTTRGIPQLLQGAKIWMFGGSGLPGVSVLIGNVNIWIRIGHLVLTRSEATEDRNRFWMLASEVVNAISWGIVSLIWLGWRFGLL